MDGSSGDGLGISSHDIVTSSSGRSSEILLEEIFPTALSENIAIKEDQG